MLNVASTILTLPAIDTGEAERLPLSNFAMGEATAEQELPAILVQPGHLTQALDAVEDVLARTGSHYRRGNRLVRISVDPHTQLHSIQEVTAQNLIVTLAGVSRWLRFDQRAGGWRTIDPCPRVCNLLVDSWPFSRLPVLSALAYQPHLRQDGTVCSTPMYDSMSGIFGVFNEDAAAVPSHPMREQALEALAILNDLLAECAFAGPEDKAAALSALLTAAVRPGLPQAPMFHVMAHQPGSGKSYLCQLITAMATSAPGAPMAFPRSNDACDKLLLARLMRAPAVIEFDNLTTDLRAFDKLCTALTSEHIEGRDLGTSRTMQVGTRTLFLSSGNNVRPVEDMIRRCVCIYLDPGVETPAARTYKRPSMLADVKRERHKYVAAALTVVRAWIVAGRPMTGAPPFSSYVDWSAWCRQPLLWLDHPDPVASVFKGMANDPAHLLLNRVLNGIKEQHDQASVKVREIIASSHSMGENEDFRDALAEAAGGPDTVNARKLGHWLARHEGRVANGLRLRRGSGGGNVECWRVESV
jgi:hypothetical protein